MPSRNMLPKGKRRHSVRAEYRAQRGVDEVAPPVVPAVALDPYAPGAATARHEVVVPDEARGLRLDQYLARAIPEISRSRVQLLIEGGQVRVGGAVARGKHRVEPGEVVTIEGSPVPPPMEARAEAIPLEVVFEDEWMAVVNKPAGMSVHAGAARPAEGDEVEGGAEAKDPRSSGTLVNALLHHFAGKLSGVGGELRPGIVHRLDKETSGLLLVAKDDRTHRRLGEAFAERRVEKVYVALVHGALRLRPGQEEVRVDLPIGRDLVRRTRMTTRRPADAPGVRHAVSHVRVLERIDGAWGAFTLVEVRIETGRTHQIRVHLQALGHPVVGDVTYGAPERVARVALPKVGQRRAGASAVPAAPAEETVRLGRNFLHAAQLRLEHPRTGQPMAWEAALPPALGEFLERLRG